MAMTHCRECGKDISDQASACPHCGAPRVAAAQPAAIAPRRSTNPWMIIGWIVLALILLPLATCMVMVGVGSSRMADQRAQAEASNPVAAPGALYNGYLAAVKAGSTSTADEYARLLRKHHPDSAETQRLPPP